MTAQLIQLLGSSDVKVRQRAWTALKGMAESGGAESQMTVQMAGGIERFVSLLKDGSLEAQEYVDCPTDDLAALHVVAHHGASTLLLPRYALWLLYSASDIVSKVSIASAQDPAVRHASAHHDTSTAYPQVSIASALFADYNRVLCNVSQEQLYQDVGASTSFASSFGPDVAYLAYADRARPTTLNVCGSNFAPTGGGQLRGGSSQIKDGDRFRIQFDWPTDMSEALGNKRYLDSLFTFSHPLGVNYSGGWVDNSTFVVSVLSVSTQGTPPIETTQVLVVPDRLRNQQGEWSGSIALAFLSSSFSLSAPPRLASFEVFDPDNADVTYSDGDRLSLVFDMAMDRGQREGGKKFVDNLLEFLVQLSIDHSCSQTSESALTITSIATHPNFLEYDGDSSVALAMARCKWADGPNDVTIPTLIEPMRVRCSSFLHSTEAVRSLRALYEEDFADTGLFTFYKKPRLAVFVTALQPEGGVCEGGTTLVTVRGAGFDVMSAGTALTHVRCPWGSIHAVGNDVAALSASSTEIVCRHCRCQRACRTSRSRSTGSSSSGSSSSRTICTCSSTCNRTLSRRRSSTRRTSGLGRPRSLASSSIIMRDSTI